jgi:threonine synthase
MNQNYISHLICAECNKIHDVNEAQNVCTDSTCAGSLLVKYRLNESTLTKEDLKNRPFTMWRYHEFLPVTQPENIITLGEGGTPLLKIEKLGNAFGLSKLYIKDEGGNPTGSFKARGMSAAISKAKELGIKKVAIPTAGNAGVALAAYGAKAGFEVVVYMPIETPEQHKKECRYYGAKVIEVAGNIGDCGKLVSELCQNEGYFNISTLKEPYRLEGKKTMGYELAEQFNWELPDVILYPTGGGTGLIGFWKAFEELEALGWIGKKRPRIIAVQSDRCDGVVSAFHNKKIGVDAIDRGFTVANGLRVPKPYADKLVIRILNDYKGTAISVNDKGILESLSEISRFEGLFPAPEGAALWAATKQLKTQNIISESDKIVLINTGNGYKYADNIWQ